MSPSEPWQVIASRKRADREARLALHSEWRIGLPCANQVSDVSHLPLSKLKEVEREIVHGDATALAELIRNKTYTSLQVTLAFSKTSTAAQDLTNCLSEIFIDDAIAYAQKLDKILEDTGNVVGPLHGVPISIKDHISVKGQDTSSGYVAWAYKNVAIENSLLVEILVKAGAVLFVKTQNPQTLMSLETDNNIFGRVSNPFNRELTAGGSSGGESALIASHGSPLGVGTDIGGSIRVPSAHCGLYGLKCSAARLPLDGVHGNHAGMDAIVESVGPLARSARDLELFCRVVLDAQPWLLEPAVLEMPWKADVADGQYLPEKLSIAILFDDGVVEPHPPITAALRRYETALSAAGHDVIDWKPLDHERGWDLIVKLYFLDGGAEYHESMRESGEPATKQAQWILNQAKSREPLTVEQIFRLNSERDSFRALALAHWNATQGRTSTGRPVDAILCPVAPTLAPPHDTTSWWGTILNPRTHRFGYAKNAPQ